MADEVKSAVVPDVLSERTKKMRDLLTRVSCGVVNQVVLENGGVVSISDETRSVFVYCKDDILDFKADLGIYDLKLFLNFLNTAVGYDKVSAVEVKDNRLYITCDDDSYQYLLADPKLVGQRIKTPLDTIAKIAAMELMASIELSGKVSAILGALSLLTTDVGFFRIAGGKAFVEVGTSIEHKARITLADNVVGEGEWKFATAILKSLLTTAQGSDSIILELRKGCPAMSFKYSGLFVALSTTADKKETK